MCGRFTIAAPKEEIKGHLYRQFGIEDFDVDVFLPRYNIAPGERIIAVISDGRKYRAGLMRWGFIPSFSDGFQIINARRETLPEKPAFRNAFQNRRCLILADGYYEWRKEGRIKIPYRIALKDQKFFSFAGIWNYANEAGHRVPTCAIVTGAAGPQMRFIHDRIPSILTPDAEKLWLASGLDQETLLALTAPLDDKAFLTYRVSPLVNNARNDSADLILPMDKNNER